MNFKSNEILKYKENISFKGPGRVRNQNLFPQTIFDKYFVQDYRKLRQCIKILFENIGFKGLGRVRNQNLFPQTILDKCFVQDCRKIRQ